MGYCRLPNKKPPSLPPEKTVISPVLNILPPSSPQAFHSPFDWKQTKCEANTQTSYPT